MTHDCVLTDGTNTGGMTFKILQDFIRKGDETGLSELSNFLAVTQFPLGTQRFPAGEFVFISGSA